MIKIEVPYVKADGSPADPEHIAALHAREQQLRGVLDVDGHSEVPERDTPGDSAQFEYDPQEIAMAEIFLGVDSGTRFGRLVERMRAELAVPMPCNEDAPGAVDDGAGGWTVELYNTDQAVIMAKFATPEFAEYIRDSQAGALVFIEEIPSVFQPHLDKFMSDGGPLSPALDAF